MEHAQVAMVGAAQAGPSAAHELATLTSALMSGVGNDALIVARRGGGSSRRD